MYKSDNQVKTYHNLQPRSRQQNHSSMQNIQQTNSFFQPDQTTSKNYQANTSRGAPIQQLPVFNPQSNVFNYYGRYNPVNHQQYRGHGQLQLISLPHGRNSSNSIQVNNG